MEKIFLNARFQFTSLLLFFAISSLANGDDRFAIAIGLHDSLDIFGPNGNRVAELAVPTISEPVKINDTTFQVSYGRDANDLLSVILTPDPTRPQSLHFNVLSKNVDTDQQAVVTLTFSRRLDHVAVDPGYIGMVQVNSRTLRHHDLSDESYPTVAAAGAEAPEVASASSELTPSDIQAQTSTAETETSPATTGSYSPNAASASSTSSSASSPETNAADADYASQGTHQGTYPPTVAPGIPLQVPMSTKSEVTRLYWSEPVTPSNGQPPPIAIDEMRLVDVQGAVTIGMPDGTTEPGEDGTVVPSGASLLTADNASAAVFIGGVDSARLLPGTNVSITQNLNGAVRHTKINLREGTVFSRVGHQPGEEEDYTVSTPEGVAAARGTEFADHRGRDGSGHYHHYVYVIKGVVAMVVNGNTFKIIAGNGQEVGMGSVPPTADEKTVLMKLLQILQQFNVYLNAILAKLDGGSGDLTAAELQYYNQQLSQSIYLVDELNNLIVGPTGIPTPYDYLTDEELRGVIPPVRRAADQMFEPYGIEPVTPY